MENEGIINQSVGDFTKKIDIIQTTIIFLIALLVPTFLGQILNVILGSDNVIATNSQLIIGSIVNTALIISALNLKGWAKIAGIVTMPSIATILGGYVFGTASAYMVYMIPAIWLGNFALVYAYKLLFVKNEKNFFLAGIVGLIIKVAIIFGFFSILNAFSIFPEQLVSTLQKSMSSVQAITAAVGIIISFAIYKLEIKCLKDKN